MMDFWLNEWRFPDRMKFPHPGDFKDVHNQVIPSCMLNLALSNWKDLAAKSCPGM